MDHTLQQQMEVLQAQVSAQSEQMTKLVEQLSGTTVQVEGNAQVNSGAVTNVVTTVNQQFRIYPWDDENCINVPVDLIVAAFAENAQLAEFCQLDDSAKTDPSIAAPYVTEALIDLTRRAHADPMSRNVYLNPRRADQALVHMRSGQWEVRSLAAATRLLFDGVATSIHRTILTDAERHQLPPSVQASACYVPMMYKDEPARYVRDGKSSMAAHLANTRPVTFDITTLVVPTK